MLQLSQTGAYFIQDHTLNQIKPTNLKKNSWSWLSGRSIETIFGSLCPKRQVKSSFQNPSFSFWLQPWLWKWFEGSKAFCLSFSKAQNYLKIHKYTFIFHTYVVSLFAKAGPGYPALFFYFHIYFTDYIFKYLKSALNMDP